MSFGGAAASSFTVDSPNQVRATAPPGTVGSTVAVTVTGPGGTSGAAQYSYVAPLQLPDVFPPTLSSFSIFPSAFLAAKSGPSIAVHRPVGTRVTYRLSEAATTTFTVKRKARGYRVGKRCVQRRPRTPAHPRRCPRLTALRGSFTHRDVAGLNRFRFRGRLAGRALPPGNYLLVGIPRDLAGNRGKAVSRAFRILRP